MIRNVFFHHFKAYRSLDLDLEPFTVLVGPNASGKTTLLEGLRLATEIARQGLGRNRVYLNQDDLLSEGTEPPLEMRLSGIWNGTRETIRITGEPKQDASKEEKWRFAVTGPAEPRSIRDAFSATAILHFESRRLAESSYSEEEVPRVDSDGAGLASVLAHLKLTDNERFDAIEQALKQVIPTVRRVRVERAAVQQTTVRKLAIDEQKHEVSERRTLWGNRIVFDMKGAEGVSASVAGEGTLMVLGLLAVVMGPMKARLVLLDDVELALHPAAQSELIKVIRAIQRQDPELQIVATSHSPFILNYLDAGETRITVLANDGFARCVPLVTHPEFEQWKDLMRPGEFWSTVGERWISELGSSTPNG